MCMPARASVPPLPRARSAIGTSGPAGAKMIAESSSSGASSPARPAHSAPSSRARSACLAPRVNTNTRLPRCNAIWITMCAEAPKPYNPSTSPSLAPESRSALNPITPPHNRGATATSSYPSGSRWANPSGTVRYSAKPPSTSYPVKRARSHRFSRPLRQDRHSPHVLYSHGMPTRSPTR